ncbi:MAG TPA: hypothetical protein DF712_17260 [Balneola sp.]|nr:hypothetical protein [Balneola sp.]
MDISKYYLDYADLSDRGIGSKVAIIKRVKAGEFPAPVTATNAPNAKRLFKKDEVEAWLEKQLSKKVVYK